MSIDSLENLISISNINFDILLTYIESNLVYDFEKEIFQNIDEFEKYIETNYNEKKKYFYENYNIYNLSKYKYKKINVYKGDWIKYKKNISDWMLNRLLFLDMEDCLEKFFYSNILIYCKKKDNYNKIKNIQI